MATIRKLTSDLEKIVLCDDVEKYVKYMVKMKSKHKTFTQVYVTGFIQACKHVKLNIAKYIYDEDLKKTVQLITQDIIFDEELNEEQVIQKKEDIYTNEEEQNALDVDDYEEDDAYEDYDPSDEFMDFISE